MNFKWFGPLALLAALVIGDQIRINRPGHKYRLAIEVETPEGVRSASGVVAVHPDRSYSRGGRTRTAGDAVYRRSRRRQKSRRAARACRRGEDRSRRHQLCGVARLYRGLRYARLVQSDEPAPGAVPVNGALIPVLVSFADPANPGSARTVSADDAAAALGAGYRLRAVTAEVVPNGYWPVDFGGALGEPVTRGIAAKLPWLTGRTMRRRRRCGRLVCPGSEAIDAKQAFSRP